MTTLKKQMTNAEQVEWFAERYPDPEEAKKALDRYRICNERIMKGWSVTKNVTIDNKLGTNCG